MAEPTAAHLRRDAYIYVRQSTLEQRSATLSAWPASTTWPGGPGNWAGRSTRSA